MEVYGLFLQQYYQAIIFQLVAIDLYSLNLARACFCKSTCLRFPSCAHTKHIVNLDEQLTLNQRCKISAHFQVL